MRTTLTILLTLCMAPTAFAQTGAISGLIKDTETGLPLEGVNVQFTDRSKAGTSNEFGFFLLPHISVGSYEMDISYTGYSNELVRVDVQPDKTTELAIGLKKQALQLEDVQVSGKLQAARTIMAVDILLRPLNTSQDILRMVPGLFIAQHAGGGKAEQIFLRGFDLDHGTDINISVDGMPVNMVSHAHGQGYADLHFLMPELVSKVQFEKGPYSTQYGNLATSSYVAFSTPDVLNDPFIKAELGSFKTTRLSTAIRLLDKTKKGNHHHWYAAGEYGYSNGYFDKPQHFNRSNLFTKYKASFKDKTILSISASSFSSSWDASGQIPERTVDMGLITRYGAIDSTEAGNTSRSNINVQIKQQLNDRWSLQQQLYYTHYRFNLFSNFTFFLNDPIHADEIQQKESRHLLGYNGTLHYNGFIGYTKWHSTLGYGVRQDFVNNSQLNHVEAQQFIAHRQLGDIYESNLFGFWNNTFDITNKLQVNAGLRYDWFRFAYKDKLVNASFFQQRQKGMASPKLNIGYDVTNHIKLFVSTGIGFHSNDTRVILQQQADKILPKVYGTDAGIMIKASKTLLLKTVLWWMYSEQEFVYVGDEGIVEPSGASKRYGIDLVLRYQPLKWLYADVDVNLTKARSADANKSEDYVPLAAPITSIGGLTAKLDNGFNASLRYRMIGKRPADETNTVIADGYILLDALVSYRWRKIEFSLSAQNLLNSEWKEAQFNTTSRLSFESEPVTEIHYTPGSPLFLKTGISFHL